MHHLLVSNSQLERECFEQAKQELARVPMSGIEYVHKILARAQEIKHTRLRAPLTINEVITNIQSNGGKL